MALDLGGSGLFGEQNRNVIIDDEGNEVTVTGGVLSTTGDPNVTIQNANLDVQTLNASILKERWNQTGSTLLNLQGDEGDDSASIHTCAAGKDTYIKSITISCEEDRSAASYCYLNDGGSLGTTKWRIELCDNDVDPEAYAGWTVTFVFAVPIKFATDIYLVMQGTYDYQWTILGWEESE